MNDKDFEATKKRVRKSVSRWEQSCGLRMWRKVDFAYHRDLATMAHDTNSTLSESERDVAGRAVVNWDYREATIHLNLDKLFHLDDDEIDYVVRHEICHLLVNEMREWQLYDKDRQSCLQHEERVVSDLAMVLGWVRIAGSEDKPAKKKRK